MLIIQLVFQSIFNEIGAMNFHPKVPQVYLDFYQKCSLQVPARLTGVETYNTNPLLQSDAAWMMEFNGFPNFLDDDHFVFMMINDFSFFYFKLNQGQNPAVYYWSTRLKGCREEASLSDFLKMYQI